MTRLHPFGYVFSPVANEWFPAIRRDAHDASRSMDDRGEFTRLATVQDRLNQLTGDGGAGEADEYLHLLYAAYRFWDSGEVTITPGQALLQSRLDDALLPELSIPHGACYVQLPQQSYWSRVNETAAHEPVDGFFAVSSLRGRELLVVAILGLREGRNGFSQLTVSATADDVAYAPAAAAPPRFVPEMAGGMTAGLRSIRTTAELLVLARLALPSAAE